MAKTIAGGAYRRGNTWVDAEGKPLNKAQIAEAERIATERAAERDEAERARLALEAQRDPTARAVAAALAPQPPATKASK